MAVNINCGDKGDNNNGARNTGYYVGNNGQCYAASTNQPTSMNYCNNMGNGNYGGQYIMQNGVCINSTNGQQVSTNNCNNQNNQYPYGQNGQYPYGQNGQYPYGQNGQYPYGQNGQYPYGQNGQYPYGQQGYGQGQQCYGQYYVQTQYGFQQVYCQGQCRGQTLISPYTNSYVYCSI